MPATQACVPVGPTQQSALVAHGAPVGRQVPGGKQARCVGSHANGAQQPG